MKLTSWNIRGLNGPKTGRLLKNMLMQEKPSILFLQETKCSTNFLEKVAAKAWPGGLVTAVDAQGASGGLAILWDARAIHLNNIQANRNFIQATFHLLGTNAHGVLTNVYFPQEIAQKSQILNTLSELNKDRPYPLWISGGDYNMIANMAEKQGGRCRANSDSNLLRDFINNNWLIDIPTSNGIFTWTNKRTGPQQIASRLDRFLISDNAPYMGGEFTASILPFSGSDHWPIELQWTRPGHHLKRPFRFEEFWIPHPDFEELVKSTWLKFNPGTGTKMSMFQLKLKHLKETIKKWNHQKFGNIFKAQARLNEEMKRIQQTIITSGRTEDLTKHEQDVEAQILERNKQEEVLWRQKSRIRWLKSGEKNTKFFHKSTVHRRMINSITHITNEQGERIESHAGIEEEFINHFKKVHQEPNFNRMLAINKLTKNIPKIITEEHNDLLIKPISLQEVEEVVQQLKDGKAPGPDGFTTNFFHKFWDLIKNEVWQVVEESRALRWMYPGFNATFITVIPKSEESNTPDKYRPIALCNTIYKITSKVIATRLKPLLPLIISPEQSGYVEGHQITDGIILTHEIIHSLTRTKKPGMLLKLDLSKAFDSLSWAYIQKILIAFGFAHSWVRWIYNMLSSVFYSILIHGIPSATYRPSRGIRQGDPLSPFLFVIMAEGLGKAITAAKRDNHIRGLSFKNSPAFTHQQFVDDNMLFGHPSMQEARRIKAILSTFSDASGALINQIKSQIFFFNTLVITQRAIGCIMGFSSASLPSKYLGAPLMASALKHSSWKQLLEKLEA